MTVNPARQALAQNHVRTARRIVARQRALVAEIRARGGDATLSEQLLSTLETSLTIFESDLAELQSRGP